MKISTKSIYGLQFLLHLAAKADNEYLQVKDVVKKESISEKYLENIVAQLKAEGLLLVKRGSKGGYKLSKKANQLTLDEVFKIFEGTDILPEGIYVDDSNNTSNKTVVLNYFKNLEGTILSYLKSMNLEQFRNELEKLESNFNYQI